MRETVLLSIKPEHAEKIFRGEKRFEFRRTLFAEKTVTKIVVYASSPVCRVIGEFDVEEILSMPMNTLWQKTRNESGISWGFFSSYFAGKVKCHAIKVANPIRYKDPIHLKTAVGLERPPQSFAYVDRPNCCV